MTSKRELRDMLHAERARCTRIIGQRDTARRFTEEARAELAEVRATHLALWECKWLHGDADTARAERDSARAVAVRLEQENALLTASLKAYAEAFGAIGTEFRAAAIATHQLLAGGQA